MLVYLQEFLSDLMVKMLKSKSMNKHLDSKHIRTIGQNSVV